MITDNLLEGSPMKLKNPVALVTGASSGIGKATAERLATAGYKVYGTSRRGATSGQRAFEMLSLDVTSDESVAAAVNALLRSEGRLDLLVNNAGFSIAPAGAEESSIEQARSIFETNFFGILRMTRAVLPHMRRQGAGRFFFQAEDGIRDRNVTGVQTCALPISCPGGGRTQRRQAAARVRCRRHRAPRAPAP